MINAGWLFGASGIFGRKYSYEKIGKDYALLFMTVIVIAFAFEVMSTKPVLAHNGDIASGEDWRITSDNELIIGKENGESDLHLEAFYKYPWDDHKDSIVKISFCGIVHVNYTIIALRTPSLFDECENLTSVDFIGADTSGLTSMLCMFSDCNSLKSVSLSGLDIRNVNSI